MGETRALATVSAEVGEPPVDRAHEGQLTVFVDGSACDADLNPPEKFARRGMAPVRRTARHGVGT